MKIGFIGLGHMGSAIAVNLVKAQHEVVVWNRSAEKAHALARAGAESAENPREAARGREVVFTMLADDAALDSILHGSDGLLSGLDEGAVHVSLSTIAVATADRLADEHGAKQQRFACAPVFGRPDAAAAGKLFIVAAGNAHTLDRVDPLFHAIGQRVFRVGEKPSAANLVKLCGNFMILSAIESMAEAMTLAEKGGVPKDLLLEVLTGSLFDAPLFKNYGKLLVEQRFRPAGFAAPLGLKDMRLVGQSAEALRVPMPLLGIVRDHLLQAIATAGVDIDWSGLGSAVRQNAGL